MSADLALRRRIDCAMAADRLPTLAAGDGDADVNPRLMGHVSTCLRCQAEMARYRKLRRTMQGFGKPTDTPRPDVLTSILATLDEAAASRLAASGGRRTVYVGSMAMATAGAAAGVLVWVSRRRPSLAG